MSRFIKVGLLPLMLLFILPWDAHTADCGSFPIIRVVDGDTIKIEYQGTIESLRLDGYDTPEIFRPQCTAELMLGQVAKEVLEEVIGLGGEHEICVGPHRDKYRRLLGTMTINGEDTATYMVNNFLARPYTGGKREPWCN